MVTTHSFYPFNRESYFFNHNLNIFKKPERMFRKINALLIIFCFICEQSGFAQVSPQSPVPAYLSSIALPRDRFRPLHLRGVTFGGADRGMQLLLDKGDLPSPEVDRIKEETRMLLRYFKIGLALPDSMFWVNLRPDAQDQVIDPYLEKTDLGKVLLEADLQLKKDLARFTHPDTPEGRRYWDRLYQKAEQIYGPQNLTIPTLTRPWIVPGEIVLGESAHGVCIYKATLKVMLEQDYLNDSPFFAAQDARQKELNAYSSDLIRKLILPKLIREVNSSKRYAGLRQVYYSLILARWFKQKAAAGAPALRPEWQRLIDSRDLSGLTSPVPWSRKSYFDSYQQSFRQGEYNKQEQFGFAGGMASRQYFSGGVQMNAALVTNAVSTLTIPEGLPEFFGRIDEFIRLDLNADDSITTVPQEKEDVTGPDGGLPSADLLNQALDQADVTIYSGPALSQMPAGRLESLWQGYKSFILAHTLALRMPVLKDFRPFPDVERFNERFAYALKDWFARETSLSGVPVFILYDPVKKVAYSLPVNTMGTSAKEIFLYDFPDLQQVMDNLPADVRQRLQLRIGWGTNGGLRGFFILEKDDQGRQRLVEFKGYTVNEIKSAEIYRSGDPLYCLNEQAGMKEAAALNELGAVDAAFTRIDTYTVLMTGEEIQVPLGQLRREGQVTDFTSPVTRMGHIVIDSQAQLTAEKRAELFAAGKNMGGQLRYLHQRARFNAGYNPNNKIYESYWHVNNVDSRGNLIDVVLRSFEEMAGGRYDDKNPEHIQLLFQFIRGDLRRFLIGTRSGGDFHDYGLLSRIQNKEHVRAFLEGFIEGYLPEGSRIELEEKDLALFPQSTLVSRILKPVAPQRAHDREMREAQREYDLDFRLAMAFFLALPASAQPDQQGNTGPDGGRRLESLKDMFLDVASTAFPDLEPAAVTGGVAADLRHITAEHSISIPGFSFATSAMNGSRHAAFEHVRSTGFSDPEIEKAWDSATTDPAAHDPAAFRYIVHAVQSPNSRMMRDMLTLELGVTEDPSRSIDLTRFPDRIAEKTVISTSFIDQDHRKTWADCGFILKVPGRNIISTSPQDAGSLFWEGISWVKQALRSRILMSPEDLISASDAFTYNEVVLTGTHPDFPDSRVEIVGVFLKRLENGVLAVHANNQGSDLWNFTSERSIASRLMYQAREHGWPIIYIDEPIEKYEDNEPQFWESVTGNGTFHIAVHSGGKRYLVTREKDGKARAWVFEQGGDISRRMSAQDFDLWHSLVLPYVQAHGQEIPSDPFFSTRTAGTTVNEFYAAVIGDDAVKCKKELLDGGKKSFTTINNLDPVAEQIKTMPAGGVVYLDVDNIIIRHDSKLYPTDKFRTVRYNMLKRANPALSIEEAAKTVIPEVAYLEMIAFRAGLINDVERISRIVALAKERKLRVVVVSNRSQDLASGTRDMIAQLGVSGIDEFHFVGRGNDTKAAKIKELMEADKVSHAVFVDDLKGNGQAVFDQISQLPGVESISVFHLQQQREERSYQDYLRSITVMLALKDLVDPGEFELLMVSALLKISEDPALRGLNELLDLIRKNGLNAPHFLGQGLVEEYFKELGVDLESDALDMEKIRKQAEREVKEEDVEDFARLLGFDDEVIVQGFSDTELAHWHDKVRQLRRAAAAAAAKAGNAVSLPTDLTAAEVEFFLEDAAQPPGSARERTPRSVLAQRFSNLLAFTLLMAATIFSGGLLLQHDDHQDDFITPDDSLPALTINKTAAFNNLTHSPMDSRYYENLKNYGTPPKVTTEGRKIFIGGVEYKVRAVAFSNVPEGQTFDDLVLDADHLSDHDLQLMQAAGVNTISTYYAPTFDFLDECMKYNIRVIVGIPYYDTRIHPGPDIKTGSYIDYMALYMNHPAVLWVKLGNEYNYHPEWFEGDVDNWYRAMDTAALTLKAIDTNHPVSTAQGYVPDIGTLDKLKNIDVIGINGYTFDDYSGMIADFKAKSPKPFIFTEAGTDSYNMITNSHDEASQAVALKHISRSIDNDPDCAGWTVFEWINEPVKGFGGWGNGPILGPLVRKFGGSGVYPDDMSNERYFGLLTEDGVPKMSYYAIMEEWSAREVLPIAAGEPEGGGPDGGAFALSTIAHALKSDFYSLYETAAGDVPVYIMRDHGLALAGWELARLKGLIYGKKEKRAGEKTVLVHFDEHHDMSDGQAYDLERPDLAIINLYYNVNQFIAPAVESGLVDEIYWVVPDDQAIDPEDSIQTYYSARLILSDGTTTAYLARQQPTQSSYPDLERIENMREVRVQKIHSRALPDLKGAGPAIVDIDADYFAFERRGGAEKDPGVIQAQIKETLDAIKEKVTPGVMTLAMSSGYTPENHTQLIMEKLVTGITGSADPQIERAVTLLNPMLAAWKMLHVPNRPDKAAEAPAEPARPVDQGQAREGGIDFRSLPLAGGPASAATDVDLLAAQLRQLAAASSITDLAQEWSRIEEQIRTQEVPWQRIKEFWAVCSQRGDGHHYKSRVVSCIVGMMRLEEESAVATPTQLKDLLVCMG